MPLLILSGITMPAGNKPFPGAMITYCLLDLQEQSLVKFEPTYKTFLSEKYICNCQLKMSLILLRP